MNKISPFLRRCLFLSLLALMVALDSTAQRFESRIVFVSNRDGNRDIYSMDVNENNLVQLTDHPAFDGYPACSPDGTRIAFSNFRFDVGNSEIYVMDADGNDLINLSKHKWHDVTPSWSQDGNKMAYVSYRDGGFNTPHHIFVMNADGTGSRNLTGDTHLTNNRFPNWSQDGSKIAFHSQHILKGYDIYVITAEGKELEQLTDGPNTNRSPVYVQDGTIIAFMSHRDGDNNIYVMASNGRNVVKLTKTPPGTANGSPSWLPGAKESEMVDRQSKE